MNKNIYVSYKHNIKYVYINRDLLEWLPVCSSIKELLRGLSVPNFCIILWKISKSSSTMVVS